MIKRSKNELQISDFLVKYHNSFSVAGVFGAISLLPSVLPYKGFAASITFCFLLATIVIMIEPLKAAYNTNSSPKLIILLLLIAFGITSLSIGLILLYRDHLNIMFAFLFMYLFLMCSSSVKVQTFLTSFYRGNPVRRYLVRCSVFVLGAVIIILIMRYSSPSDFLGRFHNRMILEDRKHIQSSKIGSSSISSP